jgi:hypothetical protein
VRALPSETYFQFRRKKGHWDLTTIKSVAKQLSDRVEAVLNLPFVTDVSYSQDTSDGGRLRDVMTTWYRQTTPDGMISGSVEGTLAEFGPNFTKAQILDEIALGGDVIVEG